MIPVFLCCFIVFIIWFQYERRKVNRLEQKSADNFWKVEQQANFTRPTDISNLEYIHIPIEDLPFMETEDKKLLSLQNAIKELSQKKIYNLTGVSNTELKLKYGNTNLPALTDCDQNFTLLARTLQQWGEYLYQSGYVENAQIVLEYAIQCKTDISKTYILLGTIYKEQDELQKIRQLMDDANALNTLMKPSILKSLSDIINQY